MQNIVVACGCGIRSVKLPCSGSALLESLIENCSSQNRDFQRQAIKVRVPCLSLAVSVQRHSNSEPPTKVPPCLVHKDLVMDVNVMELLRNHADEPCSDPFRCLCLGKSVKQM